MLAELHDEEAVVRVPGRAAEVLEDGGRDLAVEAVELWVVLGTFQDLALAPVRLADVQGAAFM